MVTCYRANMLDINGDPEPTPMAHAGDGGALRRGEGTADALRGRALSARSMHALGARGDGAPLAGGTPARPGASVPGDLGANGRVDNDGDARGALAPARRGRVPAGARPRGLLKVALPVKGRLRDPAFRLLEDA